MFNVNEIITDAPDVASLVHGISRILGVSEDRAHVALIRIDKLPIPAPYSLPLDSFITALDQHRINTLKHFDIGFPAALETLSDYQRAQVERALAELGPLAHDELAFFDSEHRALALRTQAKAVGRSHRNLRRLYYRYLSGGMTPTAMAGPPRGNSAKKQQAPGTARRGRKPKPGAPALPLADFRTKLEAAIEKLYKPGEMTTAELFEQILDKYFVTGIRRVQTEDGPNLVPIRLPESQQPSRRQFDRICREFRAKLGIHVPMRRAQRDAKRGRATQDLPGPGARFEIDATKLQIRIVSRYNRARVLKTATLYIVIDVWSGAIVGYALSLENAGWALAARALRNCFTDKGEVFKRLGLRHTSSEWPAKHLPTRLTADRAEFLGTKASAVPNSSIKLEIMKAFHPQGKGTVEGTINQVKHGNRRIKMPGKFRKLLTRGEKDGKKEAALTFTELECIVVEIILLLNKRTVVRGNIPPEAASAGVRAITRIGLFAWGLTHRTGYTRTLTTQEVHSSLLTPALASMTAKGILFKNQTYFSPILSELGFIARANREGSYKVNIRYDEYIGEEIWFLDPRTGQWTPISNDNPDVARLKATFWEMDDYDKYLTQLMEQAGAQRNRVERSTSSRLNRSTHAAVRKAAHDRAASKGKLKTSDIRKNSAMELLAHQMNYERDTAVSLGRNVKQVNSRAADRVSKVSNQTDATDSPEKTEYASEEALELWRTHQ